MLALAALTPPLSALGWADYERDGAYRPLRADRASLRERLLLGRVSTDDDEPKLMEESGSSIELVDPAPGANRTTLWIRAGGYSRGSMNTVQAHLRGWGATAPQRALTAFLDATMLAWDADHGSVTTVALDGLFPYVPGTILMGSILWLPVPPRELPELPASVRIEPRGARSSLLVLTEERFDLDDPAHVTVARGTHDALTAAGLLKFPS
jgi:hypothetical protein